MYKIELFLYICSIKKNTQEIINNKYRVRPTKAFNFSDLSSRGGVWSPPQYNEPNIKSNQLN